MILYSKNYSGANSRNLAYGTGTSIAYPTCCGERITQHCCGRLTHIPCFRLFFKTILFCFEFVNNVFLYMLKQFDFVRGSGAVLEYLSFEQPFFSATSLPSLNYSLGFVVFST